MLASAKRFLHFAIPQLTKCRYLSNESGIQFETKWSATTLSTRGTDASLLQSLQVTVTWPSQDKLNSTQELVWKVRRASTPNWAGL
jgi:hypothetical protein